MTSSLVHLLRGATEQWPDSEALVFGKTRVTYKDLWSSVCKVASFLGDNGLKPGDRVGILVENSPEYVAAYYGALAAGGVAIGLNTSAKARDLLNWLTHAEASVVFASARNREIIPLTQQLSEQTLLVTLQDDNPNLTIPRNYTSWKRVLECKEKDVDLQPIEKNPHREAAIIYTSGTTGNPKGVTLSHSNLLANTVSILEYLRLNNEDKIVNVLPFYYSYGNSILHTHLAVGGTVVLENSLMYPKKVLETMVSENATGFSGVPSTFALLLSRTKLDDYDLKSLRYLTQAGGPMPPSNVQRLRSVLPHVEIVIMYGQTEATARLTYLPSERLEEKLGSCGIPIPGVKIEIRDKEGKPVLPDQVGEICATGENIMLGYWKNTEMTKQVVVDGWLQTGDIARRDADGYIFITGRSAEMIKSGGQRISPKEIEEVISELDAVAEVGVAGVPDEMLGQVIKAVIIPKPSAEIDPQQVKNYCLKHLAHYKVPKFIELAEELPKTASGKLRRHLL